MWKKGLLAGLMVVLMAFCGWNNGAAQEAGYKDLDVTVDISDYEQARRIKINDAEFPPISKNITLKTHITMNDVAQEVTFTGYKLGEGGYQNLISESAPFVIKIYSTSGALLGEYGYLEYNPRKSIFEAGDLNLVDVDRDDYIVLPRWDNAGTLKVFYGYKPVLSIDISGDY